MELRLSETASGLNNAIFARAFKSYVCCKMMHKCLKIMKDLTELYIIMHTICDQRFRAKQEKKFQRKKIKHSNCDFLYFLSSIVLDGMVNTGVSFN